jgi:hypothetical protein
MRRPCVTDLSPCARELWTRQLYGDVMGHMPDPLTKAHRYRKVSVEFSSLAKRTSSDFSRGYYQRIAVQYQTLADGELGWRHGNATKPEEKPMFCAKVWAYREQSGKKYFEVFLNNGSRARIDFLEGLTTQQSFVALGRALNEKLGSCSITAMNDLVLFDESDGLSAEQKRKLFNALGSRLELLPGGIRSRM